METSQWDKLLMKEKAAMIKVAVDNGISNLNDIRKVYNEFAEGGDIKTSWTMEDEAKYREWRASLPDNLKNTNDSDYDMRGAFKAGMQPVLENDGFYHLDSRDPRTGRMLKSPGHPTHTIAAIADASIGYFPYIKNGKEYTDTWRGNALVQETLNSESLQIPYIFNYGRPIVEAANKFQKGGDTNDDISNIVKFGLGVAKLFGIDKKYKGRDDDTHYRQNLYNLINPTDAYPRSITDAVKIRYDAINAKSDSTYGYRRKYIDPVADAAWAKRLGLPYDEKQLISNPDGSFRLPKNVEAEIPIDTTFLKNRIASNLESRKKERKAGTMTNDKLKAYEEGLKRDQEALDSLRRTYSTGEPVVINENAFNSRQWIHDNGHVSVNEPTPLNVLKNFTIQYDKDTNTMKYWDTYDFNLFEDFVPSNPFEIKGSIKLR